MITVTKKCNDNKRTISYRKDVKKDITTQKKMQIQANTIPERKHPKRIKRETGNTPMNTK